MKEEDVHLWGANASNSNKARVIATIFGRPGEPFIIPVEGKYRDDYETALKKARSEQFRRNC